MRLTERPLFRRLIPPGVSKLRRRMVVRRAVREALRVCEGLSVEQTFETIYKKHLWGGDFDDFYSGTGSDAELGDPYCDYVRQFVREHGIKSIVDIGCGDFRVGRKLLVPGTSYLGIDVVPPLIERNRREFGGGDVGFQVLNAIDETPPTADLCLIRQVLQHLSNKQVLAVLGNCRSFRILLVSEHLRTNGACPVNIDKPHGPDTRASGIWLDQPPFSFPTETVLEIPVAPDEVIRTVLINQ